MTSKSTTETILILKPGLAVSKVFYYEIKQLVEEAVGFLKGEFPDRKCTLQFLCGDEFWLKQSNGERRKAGRVMVFMVERELVPFRFADYSCRSPKRYVLK